jgi:hypothetical protein
MIDEMRCDARVFASPTRVVVARSQQSLRCEARSRNTWACRMHSLHSRQSREGQVANVRRAGRHIPSCQYQRLQRAACRKAEKNDVAREQDNFVDRRLHPLALRADRIGGDVRCRLLETRAGFRTRSHQGRYFSPGTGERVCVCVRGRAGQQRRGLGNLGRGYRSRAGRGRSIRRRGCRIGSCVAPDHAHRRGRGQSRSAPYTAGTHRWCNRDGSGNHRKAGRNCRGRARGRGEHSECSCTCIGRCARGCAGRWPCGSARRAGAIR